MAIVEQVGKDRRGVPIYKKDEDGAEILFAHEKKWLTYADNGREIVRSRRERIKRWLMIYLKWLRLMLNLWRNINNEK